MRLTPLCWNSSISCSRHERHRPRRRDEDGAPPIAHAQTVSQPYIVALMTEAAALKSTDKVLEIGTGSGARSSVNCGSDGGRASASRSPCTFSGSCRAYGRKLGQGSRAAVEIDQRINCLIELRGRIRLHALLRGRYEAVCV
ncbi:protein-L-isoaspartate O-methyltransferase family protein [Bradyrhizobium canariense]|uniref:protein-L-isoaspartate O-methyltransferase family protein n=1 Tax=Bradyrhizobium canariense TaxID=255045 RepID=UPI002378E222|nr:hypothetical protein [Bradyrhizobium canariense]